MWLRSICALVIFVVCALAMAGEDNNLLSLRAARALDTMQRSLTTVTMASVADSESVELSAEVVQPDPIEPATSNPGSVECGYTSDPMAEFCYEPTSVEAGCPPTPVTSLAAGCPKFTSASGCDFTEVSDCRFFTYPIQCKETVQAGDTCSPAHCGLTVNDDCIYETSEPSCPWTHRQHGNCTTNSEWCNQSTMANNAGCDTKASGNCNHQSWNISCITTFGGNDCTNTGACLATYGLNCQQTVSGPSLFNCGSKTVAAGVTTSACTAEPGESGSGGLLLTGVIGLSVFTLRGRFGI